MAPRRKPDPDPADPVVAMVPLSQLYLHELNVRTEPPEADIAALAESIRAIGLLQNLSGFHEIINGEEDRIGIVAGGRRLRALRLIAGDTDPMVPVRITDDESTARLWASAENTARMSLHPADEITAYGRMAQAGADANAIARAFAVTEAHVRRRLKLASLPDAAIDALRTGSISLDQAAALTVAGSAEEAEQVLTQVLAMMPGSWGTAAEAIRRMLTQSTVPATDRRAVFVGLDAYQAAGGEVQRDLFTDHAALRDANLLDQLFAEKLEAAAEAERQRGWKWVKPLPTATGDWEVPTTGLQPVYRVPLDLPQADLDEMDELERLGETDEWTEPQEARYEELSARAAGDFAEVDIATSGVFLFVGNHGVERGVLVTTNPFRRREDDPARAAAAQADDTVETRPVETKALPAALLEDLTRIRRAALEVELVDCPGLMLDLLAYSLSGGFYGHNSPVMMLPTAVTITPEKPDGFDLPARLAGFGAIDARNTPSVEAFEAFRGTWDAAGHHVPASRRALTLAIARCIRPGSLLEAYCASRVDPKPRAIWTPTKDGLLSRLPVPRLDEIWAELVPNDKAAKAWSDLKKAQKAAELHDLFNNADYREALGLSREEAARIDAWIPPELQWPEVERDEAAAA